MPHDLTAVTEEDRKSFQRWLRETGRRYTATRGMRERPEGLRADHARITSGSVAIRKDIEGPVARALAALVLHGKGENDPLAFLSPWVGPFQDVAGFAVALLNNERDSLKLLAVFGLWCEDDGCRQFIRPVAVMLSQAPNSFFISAVCGRRKCQCVTVMWADDDGVWVRSAPELKGRNHPMRPHDIYAWVRQVQPPRNRPAPLIAPQIT